MTKSLYLSNVSLFFLRSKLIMSSSRTPFLLPPPFNLKHSNKILKKGIFSISTKAFSITSTPYPLQYDMIINRPTQSLQSITRRRPTPVNSTNSQENQNPDGEMGFDNWVDKKLALEKETKTAQPISGNAEMTKSMRKYYNKRRKRMYESYSDDEYSKNGEGYVELKPEVVEFNRLHKRDEELYFYDTFAYAWEKDKHYKMAYQSEKKCFPDQCLDKAFLDPSADQNVKKTRKKVGGKSEKRKDDVDYKEGDKRLVFFDDQDKKSGKDSIWGKNVDVKREVSEKKVEEFFKCLNKVPNKEAEAGSGEPYVVTRSTELPPTWDGPFGTMVLVNKPKGEPLAVFGLLHTRDMAGIDAF